MNKKRFYLVLILFNLMFLTACAENKTLIKLSMNDCNTCSMDLFKIVEIDSDLSIILEKKYISDSVGIFERFNLEKVKAAVVWSDEEYAALSKSPFSEVLRKSNNKVTWRSSLKNINLSEFQSVIGNSKTVSSENCTYGLPTSFTIWENNGLIYLRNNITYDFSFLNTADDKLSSIQIQESDIESFYKNIFKNDEQYLRYKNLRLQFSQTKPIVSNIASVQSNVSQIILVTYKTKITGTDSMASKLYSIHDYSDGNLKNSREIDLSEFEGYLFNENHIIVIGKKLYCLAMSENEKNNKLIGEFTINDENKYTCNKILPFEWPEEHKRMGYKSQYLKFIDDKGHVTFPYSDYIANIKTGEKIKIPIQKSLYESNGNIMKTRGRKFAIWDINYNDSKGTYDILYNQNGDFYVITFKEKTSEILKNSKILSNGEYDQNTIPCFSSKANTLIYKNPSDKCLKMLEY